MTYGKPSRRGPHRIHWILVGGLLVVTGAIALGQGYLSQASWSWAATPPVDVLPSDHSGALGAPVDVLPSDDSGALGAPDGALPSDRRGALGSKRTPAQQVAALKFAQCIRENGVKDFPDPAPGAPLVDTDLIPSTATNGGMSILNAAMRTCRGLAAAAGAHR